MKLEVQGDLALFTRPETKAEPFSYDTMTFTAAKGVIESVYWHPGVRVDVHSVLVLNPIERLSITRNMVKSRAGNKPIVIERDRTQRHHSLLKNVRYVIDFSLYAESEISKHVGIMERRIDRSQCFVQPFLGCKEYAVSYFGLPRENQDPHPSLMGRRDMGFMPYQIDYLPDKKGNIAWKEGDKFVKGFAKPVFKHFAMNDGMIRLVEM